jgi:hypothetical protein
MVRINTGKSSYSVEGIEGAALRVRQPSGKKRLVRKADLGSARYFAAVSQLLAESHRERVSARG